MRIEETAPISKLKTWKVIDRVDTHATPGKADAAEVDASKPARRLEVRRNCRCD